MCFIGGFFPYGFCWINKGFFEGNVNRFGKYEYLNEINNEFVNLRLQIRRVALEFINL